MVVILSLAYLQLLRVIFTVNESHNNIHMRLPFNIFEIPYYIPNDYSDHGRVDDEFLVDLMSANEPVQRLLHRHVYLK